MDLDNSVAVQNDFVRLSQSLQVELEKIRQAESEVSFRDHEIDDENFDKVYFSKRSIENISYLTFTSFLNFLYESKQPLSKLIIQASFSVLNRLPILKNLFIKQAMGKINLVG